MDRIKDRGWLESEVAEFPIRLIAKELDIPYSRLYKAIKDFGITVPKRNGYIYTEEARENKSISQKAAYKKKYPNGRFKELHPRWSGGRRKLKNGYVKIYSPDHPRAGRDRAVFEHILVAEKKIGRYLLPGEIVHHINHRRDDNRPENLAVVTRSQHVKDHYDTGRKLVKRISELETKLKQYEDKYGKLEL